ncbi:major facilitator superfamily domain-containing protein [Bisporella sp. PMI_857]|nr:major facilitator superfamily domain-containing protein [Bisporella sp. PMI_857]
MKVHRPEKKDALIFVSISSCLFIYQLDSRMVQETSPEIESSSVRIETGIQHEDSTLDETSVLLPKSAVDVETGNVEERWSKKSLAPGFFWIETAIFCNVFLSGFDGTITASTYAVIGSDFNAANTISWLTTAYLITTTAFQPLYGRFSDILGRRAMFFTATVTFSLGCLGCGLAPNIIFLNVMRGLTGLGGGGLITMATIINSDIIPLQNRGMYQAVQNGLHGFGAICGASLGGVIADTIGWRWCFLCQVPVSFAGLVIGYLVIRNPPTREIGVEADGTDAKKSAWIQIDVSGAVLLVVGLSVQLAALSLGGNQYPWSDLRVILCFVASVILLVTFIVVELRTKALPVMPMHMLKGRTVISNMISNVLVGMSSYAFLFMIPLFFQVVLLDSASKAGMRLVIPSLSTPIGGLIAGYIMSHFGQLSNLVRCGCFLMTLGNALVASLQYQDSSWKYVAYLFPANIGQGIVYPSILFTNIAAFEQAQQAVSTSTVYLFRSMGTVWGVAAASTIIQNILSHRLPVALIDVPNKDELITSIRHSVTALRHLDPEIQDLARRVYFEALRYTFLASTAWAGVALFAAFFARGKRLDRGR